MSAGPPLADVVITLGARDLISLRAFYRRLNLPEIIDEDDFAAFDLHGVALALYTLHKLAGDGNVDPYDGDDGIRFSIGIMVDTPEEVDQLTDDMRRAGAVVTKEPADADYFAGRSAYVRDPEGNFFEITWAGPTIPITARRRT